MIQTEFYRRGTETRELNTRLDGRVDLIFNDYWETKGLLERYEVDPYRRMLRACGFELRFTI